MPPKSGFPQQRRTSFFIWFIAILCTIITVAVIFTGLVVFVGYLVVRPKVPSISVVYTHLDVFDYDYAGLLTTEVSIMIKWENDNMRAHASFYDSSFILSFHGLEIAQLVASPFEVKKNHSEVLHYQVESSPIPLNPEQMILVDMSLKRDHVTFQLVGSTRSRWRVGVLGSVKFRLRLNCELHFILSSRNGTRTHCSSKSK